MYNCLSSLYVVLSLTVQQQNLQTIHGKAIWKILLSMKTAQQPLLRKLQSRYKQNPLPKTKWTGS